jgi:hypothetical protein
MFGEILEHFYSVEAGLKKNKNDLKLYRHVILNPLKTNGKYMYQML